MKANQIYLFLTILFFIASIQIDAQRACGTDAYTAELLEKDEKYAKRYHELTKMKKTDPDKKSNLACASTLIVPVAVHFNDPVTCADPVCLMDIVEAQLAVLNAELSASNADLQEYFDLNTVCPTAYPLTTAPVQGDGACIQLCLARTNHPPCSGLANGDPAITVGQHDWSFAAGWEGYLNIFVSGSGGGLGVSVLPGSANGDGFWVTYSAFGAPNVTCTSGVALNTSITYGFGRTATHEAGHYFGLPHVFGSCNDSDNNPPGPFDINDTPGQSDPYWGDPVINSCTDVITQCNGNPISFFSFMDYTDDIGYIMFTEDQSAVINWNANNMPFKSHVTACSGTYGPVVCQSITPATCADNIQNQDEQFTDCGGTNCTPCPSICGAKFYDESGPCSAYSDNSTQSWTFCPDIAYQTLSVVFNEFKVEPQGSNSCWDYLLVYDGNSTAAPQIGGQFCGLSVGDAPGGGLVSASAPGGCLTFVFDSDQSVIMEGWDADIFCETTLPIELVGFDGKHEASVNHLSWATNFEIQNEGFEILRSKDGSDFLPIGFVEGQERSTQKQNYQFLDRRISAGQTYFYQLKQKDSEGRTTYSEIISIEVPLDLSTVYRIFPNPLGSSGLHIETFGIEQIALEYELHDLKGKRLLDGQIGDSIHVIDTSMLPGGIYVLRIIRDDQFIDTRKIVKL